MNAFAQGIMFSKVDPKKQAIKLDDQFFNLIGNTPLIDITNLSFLPKIPNTKVYAKLEMLNYGGSVKDRPAYWMIKTAEQQEILTKDKIIIEPTSGNTGIGIAWIATLKGYKVKIVMPETMSLERRKILQSFGAELILTPGEQGTDGAIKIAKHLAKINKNYIMLDQFSNYANVMAHFYTTGPEIWKQMGNKVDHLILGVGSGGTIMGMSKYLKQKNPQIKIVGIGPTDETDIPGLKNLSKSITPEILDISIIDEYIKVSLEQAIKTTKLLAKEAAILAGPSSGAALIGVIRYMEKYKDKIKGNIVTLFPDTGYRYLSQKEMFP